MIIPMEMAMYSNILPVFDVMPIVTAIDPGPFSIGIAKGVNEEASVEQAIIT